MLCVILQTPLQWFPSSRVLLLNPQLDEKNTRPSCVHVRQNKFLVLSKWPNLNRYYTVVLLTERGSLQVSVPPSPNNTLFLHRLPGRAPPCGRVAAQRQRPGDVLLSEEQAAPPEQRSAAEGKLLTGET